MKVVVWVSRFSDAPPIVAAGAAPILSFAKLETVLNVIDAPEAEQRLVIARWLEEHAPDPILVWNIQRRGWSDLLPRGVA